MKKVTILLLAVGLVYVGTSVAVSEEKPCGTEASFTGRNALVVTTRTLASILDNLHTAVKDAEALGEETAGPKEKYEKAVTFFRVKINSSLKLTGGAAASSGQKELVLGLCGISKDEASNTYSWSPRTVGASALTTKETEACNLTDDKEASKLSFGLLNLYNDALKPAGYTSTELDIAHGAMTGTA